MKSWTSFWLVVALALVCDCIVRIHEIDVASCDRFVIEGDPDAL